VKLPELNRGDMARMVLDCDGVDVITSELIGDVMMIGRAPSHNPVRRGDRDFPTRIFHRVRRYKANIEGASCTSPKQGLLLKGSALQMGLENGVLSFATSLLSRDLRRRVDDDFRFALVQLNPCQTQPRFCPRIAVGSRVERRC